MKKKKTDSIIITTVANAILMTIGIIIGVICLLNRQRERERREFANSSKNSRFPSPRDSRNT